MAKSIKATNQNRGATTRISNNDVTRCTRQCASSGNAQPVFRSLPIAIQEFCSMKSAMTCFTVRSNIHPTSAPTGTEDDMEGNNKADALCWGLTRWRKPGSRRSAQFSFSNPDGSNDDIIYGISRTEMHLWVVRKNNCVTELLRHRRAAGAGKVT